MTKRKSSAKAAGIFWPLLLSWLTSLLLVVLALLLVLATTVNSAGYMKKQLEKSSFSNVAYTYLCEDYTSYASATGFDPAVLTTQISPEKITEDMNAAVDNLYQGDTSLKIHQEIVDDAYNAMKADLEQRGLEITDTVEEGISIVADACRQKYVFNIAIPMASQISGLIVKLDKVLWIAVVAAVLLCAASLVLSLRLARNPAHGTRCLIFSMLAAALACGFIGQAVYPLLRLNTLALEPLYLKLFVLSYMQGIFTQFHLFTAVYGVIAAVLLVLMEASRLRRHSKA